MNLELTHAMAFGLSLLVLLIWYVLVFARAGFWRVRKPAPPSPRRMAARCRHHSRPQ